MTTMAAPRMRVRATTGERMTGTERLFVAAAALAPIDLLIGGAFTIYDFILGILFVTTLMSRRPLQLPRFMALPCLVFLGAALVSTVRAPAPLESIGQIFQFGFIFFVQIPVTLALVRTRRILRATVVALIIGSLVGAVAAYLMGQDGGAGRIVSFFSDNPNRLGYPTSYLLPFVVYFMRRAWIRGRRASALLLGGVTLYIFIWALAASASRSASLALLVTLLVLVHRPPLRIRRTMASLLVALIAVVGLSMAMQSSGVLPGKLGERVGRTFEGKEDLVADRSRLARAGLRAFAESPFVGTGLDNFRYVASDYEATATDQLPHNLWIQFLAQIGLVGTLAFAILMARWFIAVFRRFLHPAGEDDERIGWALIASMASVMTIFMFVPLMIHRHYWLLFALGIVLTRLGAERNPKGALPR